MRRARLPRLLLAVTALVAAPAAGEVDVAIRPASEIPAEVLSPADGAILVAGQEATIAWRAGEGLASAGVDEWEAFLSFDGGRHWPVRITPHLDADLTSFDFVVPPVASAQVRLMLRFGDERRESGYVLPIRLRTVVPAHAWSPPKAPAWELGEAARPGAPGVVLWVEGPRDGQDPETREATWAPPSLGEMRPAQLVARPLLAPPERRSLAALAEPAGGQAPGEPSGTDPRAPDGPLLALPLLLLLRRRNE